MKKNRFLVICDNIRSTHNVGSIFRTSDGAGVDQIYLCGITPRPPRKDIDKVSLGAEKSVPFIYRKSTLSVVTKLKKQGYQIVALENNIKGVIDYRKFKPTFPLALIIGSEVGGINPKILKKVNHTVSIPMRGKKESLNVSVAFGIIAYAISPSS
jgi:tRNA G18 (ribose-2'-O)-methylase SpoU